jgi:hypothetical protein
LAPDSNLEDCINPLATELAKSRTRPEPAVMNTFSPIGSSTSLDQAPAPSQVVASPVAVPEVTQEVIDGIDQTSDDDVVDDTITGTRTSNVMEEGDQLSEASGVNLLSEIGPENGDEAMRSPPPKAVQIPLEINGITYVFEYTPVPEISEAASQLAVEFCRLKGKVLGFVKDTTDGSGQAAAEITDMTALSEQQFEVLKQNCMQPVFNALIEQIVTLPEHQ